MSDEGLQNATRNKPTNEHWHEPAILLASVWPASLIFSIFSMLDEKICVRSLQETSTHELWWKACHWFQPYLFVHHSIYPAAVTVQSRLVPVALDRVFGYWNRRQRERKWDVLPLDVPEYSHTSAYVNTRQHTSAHVSTRQREPTTLNPPMDAYIETYIV